MAELAVTAIGSDRPGIIARVSAVLLDYGGNIEDSTMTILRGQFAMMLLVETSAAAEELEQELTRAAADLGLLVTVRPVGAGADSGPPSHVLSVYGADRLGIVHAVAATLAEHEVNVTDLTTRVIGGERAVYAMLLEISLPEGLDADALLAGLREQVGGVEVSLHALEVETF